MTITKKCIDFLDKAGIHYETAEHPLAYTASEVAGQQHIPGRQMVKSVIVKSGSEYLMCVLPAIHLLDFEKLKAATGMKEFALAGEEELKALFPEYDVGAEPPFGHLHGLKVIAESSLDNGGEIFFNAGTHTDVIKLAFDDYKRAVKPQMAEIGTHI